MATDVNLSAERIQIALRSGEMKVTGRLVDASNATLLASIYHDDIELVCIYKPIAGERPLWDFSDGTLAHREYAAYVLSEKCNFNVVPMTVLREGPFGEGAVQLWIDVDQSLDMIEYFQRDIPELRKMALFDAIVNNTDRKIGHILPDITGKVYGCDHGVTFHSEDKLRTVLWRWAGESLTNEELSQLGVVQDFLSTPGELKELLTEREIEAVSERVSRLKETGAFPVPSKEWPAVPWPPY